MTRIIEPIDRNPNNPKDPNDTNTGGTGGGGGGGTIQRLVVLNVDPIFVTEMLEWNPEIAILNKNITTQYFLVHFYADRTSDSEEFFLGDTRTTSTPKKPNYTIPATNSNGAPVLLPGQSFSIQIEQFYISEGTTNVVSKMGPMTDRTVQTDLRNIIFTVNPTSALTSGDGSTVTINTKFEDSDWNIISRANITLKDGTLIKNVKFPGQTIPGADQSFAYWAEVTETFVLNVYFNDGTAVLREATFTMIFVPPKLDEGDLDYTTLPAGTHIVKYGDPYSIDLNPVQLRDITIFFNFKKDTLDYRIIQIQTYPLPVSGPVSIPIFPKYIPTYKLNAKRCVNASWGYNATTIDEQRITVDVVESFVLANPKSVNTPIEV